MLSYLVDLCFKRLSPSPRTNLAPRICAYIRMKHTSYRVFFTKRKTMSIFLFYVLQYRWCSLTWFYIWWLSRTQLLIELEIKDHTIETPKFASYLDLHLKLTERANEINTLRLERFRFSYRELFSWVATFLYTCIWSIYKYICKSQLIQYRRVCSPGLSR